MKLISKIIILSFIFSSICLSQLDHFSITLSGGDNITSQIAGVPFFIEIVAKDSVNGTVDSFNGTVEVSSSGILLDGSGTTNSFVNGVLTSLRIKFSNTGSFNFTIAQTSGVITGTSNTFSVDHGIPAILRAETEANGSGIPVPPQTLSAGSQITMYAISRDTLNNFVANLSGSIWTIHGIVGGIISTDISPSADSSSAVFSAHLVGSCEIHAASQNLSSESSGRITVIPGNASKLTFTQQPTNGIAGAHLSPNSIVRIADNFGNFVSSSGNIVVLSIPPSQGILNGSTSNITNDSGLAIFNDLSIPFIGKKTLIASSELLSDAISDSFKLDPLIILATSSIHGTISPNDSVQVLSGSNQIFTFVPDFGYHLDSLFIDNIYSDSTTSYTFKNITTNHSIHASFSINKYIITSISGTNGTISPSGTLTLDYGSSQSFTITPSFGYHIDSILVDNIYVGMNPNYSFDNISDNHNIRAVFSVDIPVINAKVFLQGSYTSGIMRTNLQGIIPNSQPYNRQPWNYTGAENVVSVPTEIVDWILVELRTGTTSSTIVGKRAGFCKSDGTIVDIDGISPLKFPSVFIGNYYIVLYHRDHIGVMSASLVNLTDSSPLYDFTTDATKYFGGKAAALSGGKFGLYSGDSSHDGFVDSDDFMGPDNNMFKSGYLDSDHSLDGFIDSDDFMSPDNNMFIYSNIPN
jgi:hypothetical protein